MTSFCRSDNREIAAAGTHTNFRSCRVNLRVQTETFSVPKTTEIATMKQCISIGSQLYRKHSYR